MLKMATVHHGTPTRTMEILYDMEPLHIKAQELALAAVDRVDAVSDTEVATKGHLASWHQTRETLGDVATDKTVYPNWEQKTRFLTRQAHKTEMRAIRVYTDGSKLDSRVGAGFCIYVGNREIHSGTFRLPGHATVFQAELLAIEKAAEAVRTCRLTGPVTIHSDSMSSIQALEAQFITSKQCVKTLHALEALAETNPVKLFWIKAHKGHMGNERADDLAKAGTTCTNWCQVGAGTTAKLNGYKALARTAWEHEWEAYPEAGQSKLWVQTLDSSRAKKLVRLSRNELSECVQWITGFCNLMYHRSLKHDMNPRCRLCGALRETPSHLSFECPRLHAYRVDAFRVHDGRPEDWEPKQILTFIHSTPRIKEMLEDHTDYSS